jgi:VanZ family protein
MEIWKKRFWVFGFPPLLWMGVIFCLSSIPGRYVSRDYLLHHLGHLIEYFVFGVLLARAFAHLRIRLNVWMLSLLSIALIVFFAAFDEWRQSFVPGRHARLDTIFFDGLYATLGVALYSRIVYVILMRKRKALRLRRGLMAPGGGGWADL